ncbi:MAG TPA: hypothetical protein VE820_05665 [Sphingomicrobium sp.]|nr:hypothetical protein [Sphingomicrobium sp.]
MKVHHLLGLGAATALACCGPQRQPQEPAKNEGAPLLPEPSAPPAVTNNEAPAPAPEPGTKGALPDERTPLEEPKGPIDPKSPEAAGQVVQQYGALIEQKKWTDSERLWGNEDAAKKLTGELKKDGEAHLQIGKPTDMEGAAGSSYITVPILLYGKDSKGAAFQRSGKFTLRRVNDVPGSTEPQRHWHIERVDWGSAA